MRLIDADELEVNIGTIDDWYTHEFVYKYDIDDAPTIEIPKWIPVSEGLPEEGARVLISLKLKKTKKVVRSATYYGECRFRSDTGDFWNTQEDVELRAWQPLPEPYKEGE